MKKKLTLGSLFSGSGGFELAGLLEGIEPRWASEIEPFPIRVTTKRMPWIKHLGDISTINGAEITPTDIVTFGSPCFPAGTMVLTDKGYVPIEEIKVGDRVLTHKGRWRKVTDTGWKIADTYKLKGNITIETTAEHPIYGGDVTKNYAGLRNGKRINEKSGIKNVDWIKAKHMQGKQWATPNDIECLPIPKRMPKNNYQKEMPEMNGDFWYFVGRWLGDGWVQNGQRSGRADGQLTGGILICDSLDKESEIVEIVSKISEKYSVSHKKNVCRVRITSQVLCEWLIEHFGKGAINKTIPPWVLSLPQTYRESLFKGVKESDGYTLDDFTVKVTSISKQLVLGLRLLGESLGYSTFVSYSKKAKLHVIEGRTVNQNDTYTVAFCKSGKRDTNVKHEGHTWYLCKNVEKTGEEKRVYNISVDEDESYIADSIVVHNCQDMSVAGKRAGLAGERSGLFMEAIRIIKEMREATNGKYPTYIIWENVTGAYSSNKGEDFKAVLEEIIGVVEPGAEVPAPDKNAWPYADCYVGDGWSVAYRTLNAASWGVAQRRRRIFLVADFAGERAFDILFKSDGLSGYTPQSGSPWQGTAESVEGSVGEAITAGGNQVTSTLYAAYGTKWNGNAGAYNGDNFVAEPLNAAYSIGNGQVDALRLSEKARTLDCMHDAQAVLVGEEPIAFEPGIASRDGGHVWQDGKTGTLRANMGDNQTAVVVPSDASATPVTAGFVARQGAKAGSIGYEEEIAPTLRAGIDANVICPEQKAFSFDSLASNSMKSKNPHSGCREVDVAKTLDTSNPDPSKNQGGMAVLCAGFNGYKSANADICYNEERSPCIEANMPSNVLCVATQQGGAEILEDKCPTITAAAGMSGNNQPYVCAVENHPADSRVKLDESGTIQTLTSRMGTGGGNVPLVMNERQYALTVSEDLANTLTGTDYKGTQCVFEPKASGVVSKGNGDCFLMDEKHTALSAGGGQAGQGYPCVLTENAVNDTMAFTQNQREEVRDLQDKAGALAAEPGVHQQTYVLQGNMIGRADKNGPQGSGVNEDVSFSLTATDRHAVVYGMATKQISQNIAENISPPLMANDYKEPNAVCYQDKVGALCASDYKFPQQQQIEEGKAIVERVGIENYQHSGYREVETAGTLKSCGGTNGGGSETTIVENQYAVRRLTPTECLRLMGLPDWWTENLETPEPTEEDIAFWADVFETHRKIMGTSTKPKSRNQIIKWLKNPYSDSATYKMCGNGIVIPVVRFIMAGIVWAENNTPES